MNDKKFDDEALTVRDRLREEFDQAGRPGGDFYTWLVNRVDKEVVRGKEKEKSKNKKWRKK